ncbi:MAG TPA: hypothetical protein VHL11_01870, partial [Phototrophicaceae bacterium]|nr:hypothetical protein [Phototrophicaceae bacterium]
GWLNPEVRQSRWFWLTVALPVVAVGVQPVVNLLITGTATASGNQAKSLFGMIPAYLDEILRRVLENFSRMWLELTTGTNPDQIWYALPGLLIFALIGVTGFALKQKRYLVLALVLSWLLVITGAISTLDTAFWHFKRYQMPVIALLYPLAIWGFAALIERFFRARKRPILYAVATIAIIFSLWTGNNFLSYYAQNTRSVAAQPLAMARWLLENTPPDSVIAVHDVGMMRYIGNRTTVDMVGLTTPGAADYWRNGPGSVGEFLTDFQPRPDYIAAYTGARGLNYLANTGVYGKQLAGFAADYDPRYNVALGGIFQGIFQPTWEGVDNAANVLQPSILHYLTGFTLVDSIDVADLSSETAHHYHWSDAVRFNGFATEFYQQSYIDCSSNASDCVVADGGRRINGEESFTIKTLPGEDLILVTRVHPVIAGTFEVYADDTKVATRWLPSIPGRWLEIATLIPANLITGDNVQIKIVPDTPGGHYMPYMHWSYQGKYQPEPFSDTDINTVSLQDGAIQAIIKPLTLTIEPVKSLNFDVIWQSEGMAAGDYKVFVHLYSDINQPPIAQAQDVRPGRGTLPPGNWLPGAFSDHFVVDLSNIVPGTYQVTMGLYDPVLNQRLMPVSDQFEIDQASQRVSIGTVEIK